MDRLLFGDNQFFGVNHMSEEKARTQADALPGLAAVMDVLELAYDEGIRTFMCTTHDRIADVCDRMRADPERYRASPSIPCMPYAHKYADAVTEHGMLGALRRFLPDEGSLDALSRGPFAGHQGHRGNHHVAGRRRDDDVPWPPHARDLAAERLVDMLWAWDSTMPSPSSASTSGTGTPPSPGSSR